MSAQTQGIDVEQRHERSAARRRELVFAAAFVALLVVCSIGKGKLYPFEPPSFFVARAQQYAQYRVTDPNGKPLSLAEFGLGDFYLGQAGHAIGVPDQEAAAVRLPASINIYGEVRSRSELEASVQRELRKRVEPKYVTVSRRVIAPLESNPNAVGTVSEEEWRVSR